ncbi:hypothetical protein NZD89_02505 [Alicyclobacillus fastidiosus]|uniref:Uracil-DNA glycosylase-like domain-containing protein n=1 Tax=Alicyclobacillus fastidiosus TaxID=392011 RepID=A0ABY6ZJQ1_9BACL|nr:hypothetical protein [Alicyclobacillus fastidiosus]WAH42396.1 hypothetical protein NZD89_02505 [Alicyclobacillus fastidiosus]GMA64212.1 hypothetical protein GCM10025859_46520 [Alicyclobacillus fastidiosus]
MIQYSVSQIEEEIERIANEMIYCNHQCSGEDIVCNLSTGQIPRCLYFEHENRNSNSPGIVVIGMNPGWSDVDEQDDYKKWLSQKALSYKNLLNRFESEGFGEVGKFYPPIRTILKHLQLDGPILWTEVAKCESQKRDEKTKVPLKRRTTSICSRLYLSREIQVIPEDWLFLAVGLDAYETVLPLSPRNPLIGCYHPNHRKKGQKLQTKIKNNPSLYVSKLSSMQSGDFCFWD